MKQIEVNYKNSTLIWWSFFWRASIFGFIAGAVLGGIMGALCALIGQEQFAALAGAIAGFVVSIPIGIAVFKIILNKKFKSFRIVLLENEEE